jgi:cold shock CspA family protein
MQGIVKWFSSKGQPWGYIRFKDGAGEMCEVFAHYKQILPEGQENPKYKILNPGQWVEFDIGPGFPASRGTQAYNIKVVNVGPSQPAGTVSSSDQLPV